MGRNIKKIPIENNSGSEHQGFSPLNCTSHCLTPHVCVFLKKNPDCHLSCIFSAFPRSLLMNHMTVNYTSML